MKNKFSFLEKHINELPEKIRNASEFPYLLNSGKNEAELTALMMKLGISIPDELKEFYYFSYGAQFAEYKILTLDEIKFLLLELPKVYDENWQYSILPFAEVSGVGDIVAFDIQKSNGHGLAVLDGFHELPPPKWKIINFGLASWLQNMVENNFKPFWLETRFQKHTL